MPSRTRPGAHVGVPGELGAVDRHGQGFACSQLQTEHRVFARMPKLEGVQTWNEAGSKSSLAVGLECQVTNGRRRGCETGLGAQIGSEHHVSRPLGGCEELSLPRGERATRRRRRGRREAADLGRSLLPRSQKSPRRGRTVGLVRLPSHGGPELLERPIAGLGLLDGIEEGAAIRSDLRRLRRRRTSRDETERGQHSERGGRAAHGDSLAARGEANRALGARNPMRLPRARTPANLPIMAAGPIYLDYNATTPVHPVVRDAMLPWLSEQWGNPSSAHAYGRAAAAAVDEARARVASLVGAKPHEVLFTSGGTEADNLAILGFDATRSKLSGPKLVVSAVEHPAVAAAAERLRGGGWSVETLGVDERGVVRLADASDVLRGAGLLSTMLAQNETGAIQPIARLTQLAREVSPEVVVHVDAAQAVGKIAVDVAALDIDLLTIVGHKFYAPAGIGALIVRERSAEGSLRRRLSPLTWGGGQEGGLRPGTEPVASIVALGAACRLAASDLEREGARQRDLRERLWTHLSQGIPGLVRTAGDAEVLPGTLHVCVPRCSGAELLAHAPGIAASTGSACHADDESASGVLGAMGLDPKIATGAVRLSLGRATTLEEVEQAGRILVEAWKRLQSAARARLPNR